MPVKNIEEEYNEKMETYNKNLTDIQKLTDNNKALKPSLDELGKKVAEIKQVSGPYEQLLKNIENEKKEIAVIAKKKTAVVNDELKDDDKKVILDKIKEVDGPIDELKNEEKDMSDSLEEIRTGRDEAKKEVDIKKQKYDLLKNYQKEVEKDLANLKDLKINLQKEDKTAILYFLLEELKKITDKTFDSFDDLKTKLLEAKKNVDDANVKLSDKENNLKIAQSAFVSKQKERILKENDRKTDIIKILREI